MKTLLVAVYLLLFCLQSQSQTITGKVCDASTGLPLVYASIGVSATSQGTITDENGLFRFTVKDLPVNSIVRFSMIGYKSQTYTIEDLTKKENLVHLDSQTTQLAEVVIKPSGKPKKIGTTDYTRGVLCGWGGPDTGKGYEIGIKLELGDTPVRLNSFHMRIHKQSYDTSLFRLHIRSVVDNLPGDELLTSDIFIAVTKESGWTGTDLSNYNLVFDGDIVLSLEWIKIVGIDEKRLMKMNGQKQYTSNILINKKLNHGYFFTKWGTEAIWSGTDKSSPSFYVTALGDHR